MAATTTPDEGGTVQARIQAAIRRMNATVILVNHQVAERLGVGPSDAQFLALLESHGPLTPGRLAQLSGLTTGSVTGVLDRLERAGYVRRQPDPSDRRKVIVKRDEQRIQQEIAPLYEPQARGLRNLLASYSPQQLELIADFLERVTDDPGTPGKTG
jgi:DNA-binding MarR family transcriptional regulator